MTPNEKATELYNEFDMIIYTDQDHYKQVKQCALICVNEIIVALNKVDRLGHVDSDHFIFWNEVKKQIELL